MKRFVPLLLLALLLPLGACGPKSMGEFTHAVLTGPSKEEVKEAWVSPREYSKTISEAIKTLAPQCKTLHQAKKITDAELFQCDGIMTNMIKPNMDKVMALFEAADLARNRAKDTLDEGKKAVLISTAVGYEGTATVTMQMVDPELDKVVAIVNRGNGIAPAA